MPAVKRCPISLCLRCPLGDAQAERSGGNRRCNLELRTELTIELLFAALVVQDMDQVLTYERSGRQKTGLRAWGRRRDLNPQGCWLCRGGCLLSSAVLML